MTGATKSQQFKYVEALITLLEYTTDSDGVTSRPLGEFPDEVV